MYWKQYQSVLIEFVTTGPEFLANEGDSYKVTKTLFIRMVQPVFWTIGCAISFANRDNYFRVLDFYCSALDIVLPYASI